VGPSSIVPMNSRQIWALLAATVFLMVLGSTETRGARVDSQPQVEPQRAPSEQLVVQGRITRIDGHFATLKTPDGYPGGPGGHAQFVTAGPTFKVDVSHARVLLPDGKRVDKLPLAVGDRVIMVLSGKDVGPPGVASPPNAPSTYFASVIERVVQSDRIITH
jgi:hypothetical protein